MVKIPDGTKEGCHFFRFYGKVKYYFVTLLIHHYTSEFPYFLFQ